MLGRMAKKWKVRRDWGVAFKLKWRLGDEEGTTSPPMWRIRRGHSPDPRAAKASIRTMRNSRTRRSCFLPRPPLWRP